MTPILPSDRELISFCKERGTRDIRVVHFSNTITIKFGLDITPAEAATQQYVWKCVDPTIFRVPEVYRFFQHKPQERTLVTGYLVMENVHGTCLSEYLETATPQDQVTIVDGIIKALQHLATIPLPPGQGPGPVGRNPPRGYLWGENGITCSFASISEMEHWLDDLLDYLPDKPTDRFVFAPAELVMCHTDLAPRNILRLGDGQLALLDWGSAGFYPQVFEIYAFRTRVDREPIFTQILSRFPQEEYYKEQIQLLANIEYILMKYGDTINL